MQEIKYTQPRDKDFARMWPPAVVAMNENLQKSKSPGETIVSSGLCLYNLGAAGAYTELGDPLRKQVQSSCKDVVIKLIISLRKAVTDPKTLPASKALYLGALVNLGDKSVSEQQFKAALTWSADQYKVQIGADLQLAEKCGFLKPMMSRAFAEKNINTGSALVRASVTLSDCSDSTTFDWFESTDKSTRKEMRWVDEQVIIGREPIISCNSFDSTIYGTSSSVTYTKTYCTPTGSKPVYDTRKVFKEVEIETSSGTVAYDRAITAAEIKGSFVIGGRATDVSKRVERWTIAQRGTKSRQELEALGKEDSYNFYIGYDLIPKLEPVLIESFWQTKIKNLTTESNNYYEREEGYALGLSVKSDTDRWAHSQKLGIYLHGVGFDFNRVPVTKDAYASFCYDEKTGIKDCLVSRGMTEL